MSTFAVFGMTRDVALAEAKKRVKPSKPSKPGKPGKPGKHGAPLNGYHRSSGMKKQPNTPTKS